MTIIDFFKIAITRFCKSDLTDNFSANLKLLSILSTTKEMLIRSDRDGWPDINPKNTASEVDSVITYILKPDKNKLPDYTFILYLPTGPIQEVALSNGWSDIYMSLAEEYDKLEYLIKEKKNGS